MLAATSCRCVVRAARAVGTRARFTLAGAMCNRSQRISAYIPTPTVYPTAPANARAPCCSGLTVPALVLFLRLCLLKVPLQGLVQPLPLAQQLHLSHRYLVRHPRRLAQGPSGWPARAGPGVAQWPRGGAVLASGRVRRRSWAPSPAGPASVVTKPRTAGWRSRSGPMSSAACEGSSLWVERWGQAAQATQTAC